MSRLAAVLIRAASPDRQALTQLSAPLLRKLNYLQPPFPLMVSTRAVPFPHCPCRRRCSRGCRRRRRRGCRRRRRCSRGCNRLRDVKTIRMRRRSSAVTVCENRKFRKAIAPEGFSCSEPRRGSRVSTVSRVSRRTEQGGPIGLARCPPRISDGLAFVQARTSLCVLTCYRLWRVKWSEIEGVVCWPAWWPSRSDRPNRASLPAKTLLDPAVEGQINTSTGN